MYWLSSCIKGMSDPFNRVVSYLVDGCLHIVEHHHV